MIFERLTWIGFMIVAAGWALLFSAPQLAGVAHLNGRSAESAALNIPAIAECVILSGFGVGIIGALQSGFGALNKFFEAVLVRSQHPRTPSAAPSASPAQAVARAAAPRQQPAARGVAKPAPAQPRKIIERGWVKDRAYVLFGDGSVEVETMLGRRKFPSLQEAQEFIA